MTGSVLSTIRRPADLRGLDGATLRGLASEIREVLVKAVSRTGGHLGSNQTYVHKLVTGRQESFDTLRQRAGLSGYPSRSESVHDVIENSHASVALAYADGLAKARRLTGETDRRVVVVVGDGALTGGVAWEAFNNLGAAPEQGVIVVLNDNGRSYAPTVGGIGAHLAGRRGRLTPDGNAKPDAGGENTVFEHLGLDYIGPIDGHDVPLLEAALRDARDRGRSVVVHCVTTKGRGFGPAEADEADHMHGPPPFDPQTGAPLRAEQRTAERSTWTSVFGAELADLGETNADLVAITAAMAGPVGINTFAARFPDRVHDVGIAEQHAIASAAGLALAGLHPLVCLYATFLNRAFDQLLFDVALHRLPVTVMLDRAGVTGEDGPSHHGMWDLSALSMIPGLHVAAPRDGARLRALLREAVEIDGPTALRFPKGTVGIDIPAIRQVGPVDVLREGTPGGALLVAVGATAPLCMQAAATCKQLGVDVTVVDPRWVIPTSDELVDLASEHEFVVTVEDGCRHGGIGSGLSDALGDRGSDVPVIRLGLPKRFLDHGTRAQLLEEVHLTSDRIAESLVHGSRQMYEPLGQLVAVAS